MLDKLSNGTANVAFPFNLFADSRICDGTALGVHRREGYPPAAAIEPVVLDSTVHITSDKPIHRGDECCLAIAVGQDLRGKRRMLADSGFWEMNASDSIEIRPEVIFQFHQQF